MRVLYISSNKISTFSENSNAFQQPYNLCKNSDCTIITPYKDYISSQIEEIAYEIKQVDVSKAVLIKNIIRGKELLLPNFSVDNYDVIVSSFSEWPLGMATSLRQRNQLPWFVIMWDTPFGNRYEINKGIRYKLEHVLRLKVYNYLIAKCTECFAFINQGMFVEEKIQLPSVVQMVNGVDTDITEKVLTENYKGKIRNSICAIGRVRPDKGCENILAAFKLIGDRIPDATLTFIGQVDGSTSDQDATNNLIQNHPWKDRIKITGRIPFVEAMSLVSECEIGLHAYSPSKYLFWNHVLKVGEYQALGVVPVAIEYPGTSDIIDNLKTGILINSNSSENISKAVINLFLDRTILERMKILAQNEVQKRSWKSVTKHMLNIIKNRINYERL